MELKRIEQRISVSVKEERSNGSVRSPCSPVEKRRYAVLPDRSITVRYHENQRTTRLDEIK